MCCSKCIVAYTQRNMEWKKSDVTHCVWWIWNTSILQRSIYYYSISFVCSFFCRVQCLFVSFFVLFRFDSLVLQFPSHLFLAPLYLVFCILPLYAIQCQMKKSVGSKPHAWCMRVCVCVCNVQFAYIALFCFFPLRSSIAKNRNKTMNMVAVLRCDCFAVIIARPVFSRRHQCTVIVNLCNTLSFFQSVAKAIDSIIFHIENDIYPRRIIFTICAPNHEEYTWRKWGKSVFVVSMHFDGIVSLLLMAAGTMRL